MEGDLARVQDALAATEEARSVVEEARRKAEVAPPGGLVDVSPVGDWDG